MSPTVPNNIGVDKRNIPGGVRPERTGERRSELVCRVKYCNTLPDIPFDPKFITYPFESTRFIQYNPTSLERNYKYEVLTEHDLGVTIDLINKDLYTADPMAVLDIADEKLLEEDVLAPHDSRRSKHHARSVSWLRRTEYISTEQTRFQPQVMDKVEAKVGYSIKKSLKEETLYMDRESQIKAIDKTFEDNQIPIEKHYSRPNVTPVEVLEVFPDFKMWKYPCAQVMFDSDPAPVGRPFPAQLEEMSQAMIRGVMDESGEQFVAYFLPTEDTLEKRRRDFTDGVDYVDEEEYEYKIAREYNWNVKTKASKGYEENYFLVVRPDGVFFNELETRVRLTKRRLKAGQQPNNTRLVVKHRPMNAQEFNVHRRREKQLEPPQEEEEEEEEDEEDEEEGEGEKDDENEKNEDNSDSDKENRDVKKKSRRVSSDRSSGSDKSDEEKSGKSDAEKSDKSDAEQSDGGKSTRSDKSGRSDRSGSARSARSGSVKSGTSAKSDKSAKSNRSDRSEKSNKSTRSKKSGSDKSDSDKSDVEKSDNSDAEKSNRSDAEKSDRSDAGKSDGSDAEKSDRSDAEKSDRSDAEKSDEEKSDAEQSDGGRSDRSGSVKSNRSNSRKTDSDNKSDSERSDKSGTSKRSGSKSPSSSSASQADSDSE